MNNTFHILKQFDLDDHIICYSFITLFDFRGVIINNIQYNKCDDYYHHSCWAIDKVLTKLLFDKLEEKLDVN